MSELVVVMLAGCFGWLEVGRRRVRIVLEMGRLVVAEAAVGGSPSGYAVH